MAASSGSDGSGDIDMELLQQRMNEVRNGKVSSMLQTAANWRAGRCSQHTLVALDDWVRRLRCADNGLLVCGTYSGAVVLVDIESGEQLRTWEPISRGDYSATSDECDDDYQDQGLRCEVTAIEFDGVTWAAGDASGNIRVHNTTGTAHWGLARCEAPVSGLCFHEEQLYSVSVDRRLVCWTIDHVQQSSAAADTGTAEGATKITRLQEAGSLLAPSSILCMSKSDNYIALGLSSGDILLCTLSPLRTLLRFTAAESAISAVHLVTSSQLVCGSTDGKVYIWRLDETEESGRRTTVFEGHKAPVVCLVGDGEKIVSGARDGTIRVWDLARGCLRFMLQGFTAYLGSIQLSPSWLIADGTNNIVVKLDFAITGAEATQEDAD